MVFNLAALPVAAVAILVALAADNQLALADHHTALTALGSGTLVALILEWRLPPTSRPRLFWVFPVWILGLGAIGAVLVEYVDPWLGLGAILLAGIAFALHIIHHVRGPHGRWVLWMTGTGIGLAIEMVVEYALVDEAKPWWGFALRGILLAGFLYGVVRLLWSRARAAPS